MNAKLCFLSFGLFAGMGSFLAAQTCDPSSPPVNLQSVYTPGAGAQLSWDAVPGSVGVQIRVSLPSGSVVNQRIAGFERSTYLVPDAVLVPGTYTWRVQAACSTVPPTFNATPISAANTFEVPGGGPPPFPCGGPLTDIDGNSYNTVIIGDQCWMQENLKVERYNNSEPLLSGLDNAQWAAAAEGASYLYSGLAVNKDIYGLLYNWYAVSDSRGLCPAGWQVPSDADLTQLINEFGGETVAGGALKSVGVLGSGGLWEFPNAGATNISGFTAHPGGARNELGGASSMGEFGYFWTSTQGVGTANAVFKRLVYLLDDAQSSEQPKGAGYSVRCMTTDFVAAPDPCPPVPVSCGVVTDVDLNTYNTVQIGSQCWMKENLQSSKFRNGDNIPIVGLAAAWTGGTVGPKATAYDNNVVNKSLYGLMYNWYAVNDSRGLCPVGWHVPTSVEWQQMTTTLGGLSEAGGRMKQTGVLGEGTGLWQNPNAGASNCSGFTGLPGGQRRYDTGEFIRLNTYGNWWMADRFITGLTNAPYASYLSYNQERVHNGTSVAGPADERNGYSVRCVKD